MIRKYFLFSFLYHTFYGIILYRIISRFFNACAAWQRLQLFQLAAVRGSARASTMARVGTEAIVRISLIRSIGRANCPREPALNQLETKFLHVLADSSVPRAAPSECPPLPSPLSTLLLPDFFNRYLFIVAIKMNVQTCRVSVGGVNNTLYSVHPPFAPTPAE